MEQNHKDSKEILPSIFSSLSSKIFIMKDEIKHTQNIKQNKYINKPGLNKIIVLVMGYSDTSVIMNIADLYRFLISFFF